MSSSLTSQVTASRVPAVTCVAVKFFFSKPFLSQEEFFGPAASSPTLPTCSSSCTTASEARGCSCSWTRLQCASLVWSRRMRRSTGTCVPHIAICWTAATSNGSVKAELSVGVQIPNCEHKSATLALEFALINHPRQHQLSSCGFSTALCDKWKQWRGGGWEKQEGSVLFSLWVNGPFN